MIADLEQTRCFLDYLTGGEPVTFQTFSDRDDLKVKRPDGTVRDPNARIFHGTLEQLHTALARLNTKGAGVYVMVNAGDGQGRSAKNVLRVRALFIDTDGAPFPTDLPLQPHLAVQSSPGKYHLYWLVDSVELSDFSTLQTALAEHYGTDPSVKDLPRVMRLPGFFHRKDEPVMVELLEAHDHDHDHDHDPYTTTDIFNAWPCLGKALAKSKAEHDEREKRRAELLQAAAPPKLPTTPPDADRTRRYALTALQAEHDTVASAAPGSRNHTLNRAAFSLGQLVGAGMLDRAEVEDALRGAAGTCGLEARETEMTLKSGLDAGVAQPREIPTSDRTAPRANTEKPDPRSYRARVHARMRGWARG